METSRGKGWTRKCKGRWLAVGGYGLGRPVEKGVIEVWTAGDEDESVTAEDGGGVVV